MHSRVFFVICFGDQFASTTHAFVKICWRRVGVEADDDHVGLRGDGGDCRTFRHSAQEKMSEVPTKLFTASWAAVAVYLRGVVEALRALIGRWREPEHPECSGAVFDRQVLPECKPGQFVGVINELTNQWTARRNAATNQPIQRDF